MHNTKLVAGLPVIKKDKYWVVFSPYKKKIIRIPFGQWDEVVLSKKLNELEFTKKESNKLFNSNIEKVANLTLVTTRRCNFRCKYCFLGEEHNEDMSLTLLDGVLKYISNSGDTINIGFFGGEPTLAWKIIENTILFFKSKQKKVNYHITSNGTFNEKKVLFFSKNNLSITLSHDGLPSIQDKLRPLPNNKPTSNLLENSIKLLQKYKVSYKIRLTATEYSTPFLPEIIEYYNSLGVRYVQIEPVNNSSLQRAPNFRQPTADDFVNYFFKALKVAKENNIELLNSTYIRILEPREHYCDVAAGKRLVVLPNGKLTNCFEVQDISHPLYDKYIVGYFDIEKEKPIYNKKRKIEINKKFSKYDCSQCFAFPVCLGGCPIRQDSNNANFFCDMRRNIFYEIINIIDKSIEE